MVVMAVVAVAARCAPGGRCGSAVGTTRVAGGWPMLVSRSWRTRPQALSRAMSCAALPPPTRRTSVLIPLALAVAGTPRGSDGTTGSSDDRTIEVLCEGDDPATGRRTVAASAVYAVDRDDLCRCRTFRPLSSPSLLAARAGRKRELRLTRAACTQVRGFVTAEQSERAQRRAWPVAALQSQPNLYLRGPHPHCHQPLAGM